MKEGEKKGKILNFINIFKAGPPAPKQEISRVKFDAAFGVCTREGIGVQRSRIGEISVTRVIDDDWEQYIKMGPLRMHRYPRATIQLEVRKLNRDISNRKYGEAESITIITALKNGDSRVEVFSKSSEYRDLGAIFSLIDTSRKAMDLFFAASGLPEDERRWYQATVFDEMNPEEDLFKIIEESGVDKNFVETMKFLGKDLPAGSQRALLIFNLLNRDVTECVVYPYSQAYLEERSENRAIRLK